MNHETFDDLARRLGEQRSRRSAIRALGGGTLAALLGLVAAQDASAGKKNGRRRNKTCICHIPPGNPDNAHVICVGKQAVTRHKQHGDCVCGDPGCACSATQRGATCNKEGGNGGGGDGDGDGDGGGDGGGTCPDGLAGQPCSRRCTCTGGRRCKNGRCCEPKGYHCDANHHCCSGKCTYVHDNHRQCA